MKLMINGGEREVAAGSLPELVSELQLPPASILIEHNGAALRRDEWAAAELHAGDTIEIVRIVAGG
jgi:thiamine biosynthesis protein ThiS